MFSIGIAPGQPIRRAIPVAPQNQFTLIERWSMVGGPLPELWHTPVIKIKPVQNLHKVDPKIYPLVGSYERATTALFQRLPARLSYARRHLRFLLTPPTPTTMKFFPWTSEQIRQIYADFQKQVEFRFQMKRLVLHYLQRRSKLVNDMDPITLEPVVRPVLLYLPSVKSIYQINPVSLMNHWTSLLLSHDDFFIEPRFPTNPYTNLPVDILSMKYAVNKLRDTSNTNWIIESFASCHYNITKWESQFEQPLNIEAIKSTLKDKSSNDRAEYLIDFAEKQFYEHMVTFNKNLFTWLFKKNPISQYERSWEKLCTQFYIDKTLTKNTELLQKQYDLVTARCKRLTDIPLEIKTEWAQKKSANKRPRDVIIRVEDIFSPLVSPLLRINALLEATVIVDSDTDSEIELDSSEHI